MSEIKVIARTADASRKAEVTMADEQNAGEIIKSARENWALPKNVN